MCLLPLHGVSSRHCHQTLSVGRQFLRELPRVIDAVSHRCDVLRGDLAEHVGQLGRRKRGELMEGEHLGEPVDPIERAPEEGRRTSKLGKANAEHAQRVELRFEVRVDAIREELVTPDGNVVAKVFAQEVESLSQS